jgi:hypothetical protein
MLCPRLTVRSLTSAAMTLTKRGLLWAVAAMLGIAITAALTWSVSLLAGQRIGLSSEPLSLIHGLAPPRPTQPQKTTTSRHLRSSSEAGSAQAAPTHAAAPASLAPHAGTPASPPPVTAASSGPGPVASSVQAAAPAGGQSASGVGSRSSNSGDNRDDSAGQAGSSGSHRDD